MIVFLLDNRVSKRYLVRGCAEQCSIPVHGPSRSDYVYGGFGA